MEKKWKVEYENKGHSWTVAERMTMKADSKTPGAIFWKARTYHATAEQAYLSLFNRLMGKGVGGAPDAEAHDVQTVLAAIRAAQEQVAAVAAQGGGA